MGLLEDAIREHLELKRLRGADPAEVAREQREVLEPPSVEAPAAWVENPASGGQNAADTVGRAPAAEQSADEVHAADVQQGTPASEASQAAQETAELDMKSAMAEEPAMGAELPPPAGPHVPDAELDPPASAADEDSLEWEVPARAHDAEAESGPHGGQNRDEAAQAPGEQGVPERPAEDGKERPDETQERSRGQGRLSI
jgi:hypothetical protein